MRRIAFALAAAAALSMALSQVAVAADMPVKAPVYKSEPTIVGYDWTGLYIGGHVGGGWFDKDWFTPLTPINIAGGCPGCPTKAGSHSGKSWLAGGQIGFNFQFDSIIAGIEAQFSWTDFEASSPHALAPALLAINSKTNYLGTIAGRLGFAWDRTLVFVKGGAAWAHDKFWSSIPGIIPVSQSVTVTRWGWMAGGGVEFGLMNNWSAKIEYNYMDFGRDRETLQPVNAFAPFQYDIKQTIQVVKVGINYRFVFAPVTASY